MKKWLTWLCALVMGCASWIFKLLAAVIGIYGVYVLVSGNIGNGIIILLTEFLVSPYGLPKLIVKGMALIQGANMAVRKILS